jgi:hypothetical protein
MKNAPSINPPPQRCATRNVVSKPCPPNKITKMEIENFRETYEKQVAALEFNIIASMAIIVSEHGMVQFNKNNVVKWGSKKITGVLFMHDSMFIRVGNKLAEVDDNDKTFSEICYDPYVLISVYESIVKELELDKPTAKIVSMFNNQKDE